MVAIATPRVTTQKVRSRVPVMKDTQGTGPTVKVSEKKIFCCFCCFFKQIVPVFLFQSEDHLTSLWIPFGLKMGGGVRGTSRTQNSPPALDYLAKIFEKV